MCWWHLIPVFQGRSFRWYWPNPPPIFRRKWSKPVRQFITVGTEDVQVPNRSVFKDVFILWYSGWICRLERRRLHHRWRSGWAPAGECGQLYPKSPTPQFGKINNPKLDKGDFVFLVVSSRSSLLFGLMMASMVILLKTPKSWETLAIGEGAPWRLFQTPKCSAMNFC